MPAYAALWDYSGFSAYQAQPSFDATRAGTVSADPASSSLTFTHLNSLHALAGVHQPMFSADLYDRIHVSVAALDLGNLVTAQQRTIMVWNAYRGSRQVQDLSLVNADGITFTSVPSPSYAPGQEKAYTMVIDTSGPPVIDASISFDFGGGIVIAIPITGSRVTAWSWAPDWSDRMLERLEWRTDVLQAYRGEEQRRALRLGPRQAVEFGVTAEGDARRHLEAVLWNWGARVFAVPLWFDGLELDAPLAAGATAVAVDPALRQFAAGELIMLLGETSRDVEVLEIDALGAGIDLVSPTTRDWPAGTRVFPARTARIDGDATLPRFTGAVSSARMRFEMTEPAAWPASAGATTYRGQPVMEERPDWSGSPELRLQRKLAVLDDNTGRVVVEDEARMPLPQLRTRHTLMGRAEIDAWRARLFALRGKQGPIWVPSWAEDLVLVATVGSSGTALDVRWTGYTQYLQGEIHRKDIRIELFDGTVLYRRITGSTELDADTERLVIDAPPGQTIEPADVALISWLALMRQESDAAEFAWWTGDVAETAATFKGFRHGV